MGFETSCKASFYFWTAKPRLNKSEMLFQLSSTTVISFPGPYLKIPPFSSSGNSAAMSSKLKEQNISLHQNHSRKRTWGCRWGWLGIFHEVLEESSSTVRPQLDVVQSRRSPESGFHLSRSRQVGKHRFLALFSSSLDHQQFRASAAFRGL